METAEVILISFFIGIVAFFIGACVGIVVASEQERKKQKERIKTAIENQIDEDKYLKVEIENLKDDIVKADKKIERLNEEITKASKETIILENEVKRFNRELKYIKHYPNSHKRR